MTPWVHSDAVSQELLKIKSEGRSAVMHILALEAEPLFTQNDHYYRSARAKWLSHYTMAKHRSEIYLITRRTPAESVIASEDGEYYRYDVPEPVESTSERTALAALAKLGYSGLTVETLARLHPPDRHAEELAVMADVRAYFQIAYKVGRFSDWPRSTGLRKPCRESLITSRLLSSAV